MPWVIAAPRSSQRWFRLCRGRRGEAMPSGPHRGNPAASRCLAAAPHPSNEPSLAPWVPNSALRRSHRLLWLLLTSPNPSDGIAAAVLRIVRRGPEISRGKTLILHSVAAGFTNARVCLVIGRPHPWLGYPTASAFYPIPVRQLRALPPASSPPRLAATQLPSAIGSHQRARKGLAPPASTPCPAHQTTGARHFRHAPLILCHRRRSRGGMVESAAGLASLVRPIPFGSVSALKYTLVPSEISRL